MVEIIKLDHQGRGIGKINNKIIFVPNTLPGEIVEIKITNEKKNYIEGQVIKYIKTSKRRIKPQCPYYELCGGCQLMHMSYEDQLKYKQEKTENIIHKYTDNNIKINPIIKCNDIYNYRNKITLHIHNKIGLYKKNNNELININKCLLVDNNINNIIKEIKSINLEDDEITIRSNNKNTLLYYKNKHNNFNSVNVDNLILNNTIIKGKKYNIEKLNNLKFIISPTSFFQVNTKQTIKLYNKIKELANINKNDNILDLYCGTGTIGLYLSNECKNVLGVEINKDAILDANNNKELNNIQNAKFIAEDAKNIIKTTKYHPDIIIVDPPRSGLFKGMVNDLFKLNVKKLIYVSCNPITLARDLKELSKKYLIETIQPIDMFPNTYHMETVGVIIK